MNQEIHSNNLDDILSFCVNLSRHMIVSGANLERVHLAAEIICKSYGLTDVSIYLLSNHISISAIDPEGHYSSRQASIPPSGINLERLRSLNQLSYKVAEITPTPKTLAKMLERSLVVREYPDWAVLLGRISAVFFLCLIFGGSLPEVVPIAAVITLLHYLMRIFERAGLDKIVSNSLIMWVAVSLAIAFFYSNFNNNLAVVLISVSMLMIPGIPLVNAMRNLVCGRENNGILQMIKILIETMALGLGIYVALAMFGGFDALNSTVTVPLTNPALLVVYSFFASMSFGVVFGIPPKDLWLAGLGGALSRVAIILLPTLIHMRFFYMTSAALVAATYAEVLAVKRRQPSTYFAYPSIIPLIPGDLFFYALSGLYFGDKARVETNGINCLISLAGMSMGFVLSSTVLHYARRIRLQY
ncbi:MAG: threonine/serine exporter family protein [Synergistaceae bacterium]|nr:threonine/serine exporter family protein [Synergistaceae bacterium]